MPCEQYPFAPTQGLPPNTFLPFLHSLMIEDIHKRGRVPILVGGTHYYIEAVVWNNGILDSESTTTAGEKSEKTTSGEEGKGSEQERESKTKEEQEKESEKGNGGEDSTASLWEELKRVDPTMAERLHPNNERKIKRSLEVTTISPYLTIL